MKLDIVDPDDPQRPEFSVVEKLDEILAELKRLNEYFLLLNECCQEAANQRARTNDLLESIKERV